METITLFLIAISLSLDAFSLSLAYGLLGLKGKRTIYTSLIVGLFHFFKPLLGFFVGDRILVVFKIDPKYIIGIVMILIIIEMIRSLKEEDLKEIKMSFINMIGFSFFVSLDSFTLGLGLSYISSHPIYAALVFAITSAIFTFIGFNAGKYISAKVGKISKYLGIAILTILLVYFLVLN